MTSHDLIDNQTIPAFARAQRAGKSIKTVATAPEPDGSGAAQEGAHERT